MEDFNEPDDSAENYAADIENALLVAALKDGGQGKGDTRKRIYSRWLNGSFLAASHGVKGLDAGLFAWEPDGPGFRWVWYSPTGLACPLGKIFPQEDGTWAALVVAGVRSEIPEAMGAVEWAVSRLSS